MAIEVHVRRNDTIDKSLKKLKRLMVSEGVLREVNERQYYSKPSEKKKKKSSQARARASKEARMKDSGIM